MPQAKLCIAFLPAQNLDSLRHAIRKELKHRAKEIVDDLKEEGAADGPVALDVWRLDPAIARDDTRLKAQTTTTYSDLKEHATLIKTDFAGNLGDIYLDLPDVESLHLLVSLAGSEVAEGSVEPLISELLDIKEDEARQRSVDWKDSLGDSVFESRPDVIAKRQRGEDPFREIPLAILHPVFDSFLYDLHDSDLDIPSELYPLARKFSSSFSSYTRDFNGKQEKQTFLSALEELLDCKCITRTTEGASFDGISLVDERYPSLIFHRQLVLDGDIRAQVERVYKKCIQLAACDSIRNRAVLPCFVLVVAGPYISVFGAGNPSSPVVERLMAFELCTQMPSDPGTVTERLTRFFACLRRALKSLDGYYKTLEEHIPSLSKRYLPFRNSFSTADGQNVKFEYKNLLQLGKHVWLASLPNGTQVAIKFARHYGTQAHRLLAEAELAPHLYHADEDSAKYYWHMIVMGYIPDALRLDQFHGTRSDGQRIATCIQRAVDLLHRHELVFGDLRLANVLIRSPNQPLRAFLVDFDWSGKAGEARYPVGISFGGKIKWPDGVRPRGLITKDHDMYWLRNLLSLLGGSK